VFRTDKEQARQAAARLVEQKAQSRAKEDGYAKMEAMVKRAFALARIALPPEFQARQSAEMQSMAKEDIGVQEVFPEANAHGSLLEQEVSKKEENRLQLARGEDERETRAVSDSHEAMPHEESKMGRRGWHWSSLVRILCAKLPVGGQQVQARTLLQDGPRAKR
jgi:hypothetical protein